MLIWSYWPGNEGGAERQCRRVVELANGKGSEFIILTSRFEGRAATQEEVAGGMIFRLGRLAFFENIVKKKVIQILNFFFLRLNVAGDTAEKRTLAISFWAVLPIVWCSRLLFIIELRRWFANNAISVDLIHVHEAAWLAGVAAWLGAKHRVPVLAKTSTEPALPTIGYDVPFRFFWHRHRKNCFFIAQHDGLVCGLTSQGISRDRIFILPNGIDIPRNKAAPQQPGPVLYVGNFSQGAHWKAFDVLIQAWSLVHRKYPHVRLHMVGGGDHVQWERLAVKLGCRNAISFLGMLSDISSQYESACLFVLPSRVEGVSNALLEAQSFGLPCVVSDIPGNLTVVKDKQNGLTVPVGNHLALADAIIRLLSDPNLRGRLGGAARAKAERSFSMQSTVNRLFTIYQSVMKVE